PRRGCQGRPRGRGPDQQGRVLLAMRARPHDGRLPRQRLVLRRPGKRPPGHFRVAHRRRQARGAPPVRARRQRGQQDEGREVAVRRSQSLVPTLREDPADAEALSHKLMLRAGLVRQLVAGVYVYLPLGQRVLDKVNAIIREEMNAIGGQEITMPVIHPADIWKQSGRWEGIPEMFKLRDRWGRDLCLGMTHEEVVAWLAAHEIRSYRDLPQIWYQIQTKERDEARPRSGVLRTREFLMKDSYTLDPDLAALDRSYAAHESAYRKIFERCGLRFHVVQSDTGMMGGLGSHEFMAPSAAGEAEIALCAGCDYAANVELARGVPQPASPSPASMPEDAGPREVATPGSRTIAEVAAQLQIDPA